MHGGTFIQKLVAGFTPVHGTYRIALASERKENTRVAIKNYNKSEEGA